MAPLRRRIKNKVTETATSMSPRLAAAIDWARPSLHGSWGGPMNGQHGRRDIVRGLAAVVDFDAVIETGTYRGTTTPFLADVLGAPVHTVEASRRYWWFSRWKLSGRGDVHLAFGDSREFLRTVPVDSSATVFVYLDAHWEQDLPLPEELSILAGRWSRVIVMVDDFEVPDDDGYQFDDYGPDMALTEDLLPSEVSEWTTWYPTLRGQDEIGARRGVVVLASEDVDLAAAGLRTIKNRQR